MARRGLRAGEEPPLEDDRTDPPGDPESAARIICLRLLDQRARTRAELAEVLRKRGIPDGAAETVLDRYVEVGLIDDEALAHRMALAQHEERGLSGRAVAVRLRRRGLSDEVVRSAIDQIDADRERQAARMLAVRRQRALAGLEPQVQARRLVSLLGRKGYSPGLTYEIVREVVGAVEDDDIGFDGAS
jgi:regulatory protein